MNIIGTS